ncbi:MAG: EamA family transporter [Beijerinckiaceae bacterium]
MTTAAAPSIPQPSHRPGSLGALITTTVFLAVLAAAALHAGWNAMLKVRLEPFLAMVLINAGAGLVALPFLLVTGFPKMESWPWLGLSVLIHIGYYFGLTAAYARADMGQVYPIARGSAPLMTAAAGILILGEPVSWVGIAGIMLLGCGIFVMAMKSAEDAMHMDRKALLFAGLTAVTICLYTLSDGTGARVSGHPTAYVTALFVLEGLVFTGVALGMRGLAGLRPILGFAGPGLAGGAMSAAAYAIAIWAMTIAPIPLVAAVRETSVLFAAVIAVVFLKEPLRANRIVAACLIVGGLVLIRLQ